MKMETEILSAILIMSKIFSNLLKYKTARPLAYRLLFYILVCSSFFTILATAFQLYLDYRKDVKLIEDRMQQIRSTHLQGLSNTVWNLEDQQIQTLVNGILQLPDIRYVLVRAEKGEHLAEAGKPQPNEFIYREFPLEYLDFNGEKIFLGTLCVTATLEDIYQRLWEKVLVILGTQAVKTFLVSAFILFIFHYLITRHLNTLVRYAQQFSLNHLEDALILNRALSKRWGTDELDQVADAINEMRENLIRDIAARKEAEAALRESEERLQAILDHTSAVIYLKDLEGRYILVNRQHESIFHIPKENITNLTDYDMMPKTVADNVRANDRQVIERGMSVQFEEIVPHDDGPHTYISVKFPVYDSSGSAYGICGISADITDRIASENELKRVKNYLNNIINSMPSVLVGVDTEGKVTHWNIEAENSTGISSANARGQDLEKVFPQLTPHIEKITEAIQLRKPQKAEKLMNNEEKGQIRYLDIMIYPLVENGLEGAVLRVDDVTTRVRLEEMMVQTEKMMSVGGLAAGMAHEINNPLGGILQGTQNITRRFSSDLPKNLEAARECGIELETVRVYMEKRGILKFLEGIRESGERAARIVRNMLQFSRRSEPGSTVFADLAVVIERTVELASNDYDLKKQYDFRHIKIIRDFDPDLPRVPCVISEIEQVLLNLLRNAGQAIYSQRDRTEVPRIILRTRQDEGSARIEVEDNGPGMDETVRKRIFEPFFTTKGMGTGLGLSVSYFIITNNHFGSIRAESSPGKGTRFIIQLPLKRCEV
jgi:PAS domain S-box-containing protein